MKRKTERILCYVLLCALLLCACGESREKTVVEISAQDAEKTEYQTLSGDWYGWWKIANAKGSWYSSDGVWFDCCAQISEENGAISLTAWDENFTRSEYNLKISADIGKNGIYCTGGKAFGISVDEGGCTISVSEDGGGKLLIISGHIKEGKYDSFDYVIYLRPWGDKWTGDIPYYYESWYLPLIEAAQPMPDKIN